MDALDALLDFACLLRASSLSTRPTSPQRNQDNMHQNFCVSNARQLGSTASPATRRYLRNVVTPANRAHSSAMTHEVSSARYLGHEYSAGAHSILGSHKSYMSDGVCLVQYQDPESECIGCAQQALDHRNAPLWTNVCSINSLAHGQGVTNTSSQNSRHPHYTNEAETSLYHGREPYGYCGDGRCVHRATVPIFEHAKNNNVSCIINESHVGGKGDAWWRST